MEKFFLDIEVYYNEDNKPCVNVLDPESGYANELVADKVEDLGTMLAKELGDYFEMLDDIKNQ